MKTNLFIAALSLVVLAGCSSEDEIDMPMMKSGALSDVSPDL